MNREEELRQWKAIPCLDLHIAPAGEKRYEVRLQLPLAGRAAHGVASLPTELRKRLGNWLEETYAAPAAEDLRAAGEALYEQFLPGPVRKRLHEFYDDHRRRLGVADDVPVPLRLRLEIKEAWLHYLPWEFLSQPALGLGGQRAPLLVSRFTTVPVPPGPLPFRPPLRILAVVTSLSPKKALSPEKELAKLRKPLRAAVQRHEVQLQELANPTREALAKALCDFRPHVLHYIGHGYLARGGGYLALVHEDRSIRDFLSPADLGAMLPPGPLRLAGLQTPSEAPNYRLAAFASFAADVAAVGVPGICFSLRPETATAFARLYLGLADGLPVDLALRGDPADASPALAFHRLAATSQLLTDPQRAEVSLPPEPEQVAQTRNQFQQVVLNAVRDAPQRADKHGLRLAGKVLLSTLDQLAPGARQLVLGAEQTQGLRAAWQELERRTQQATGKPLQDYLTLPPDALTDLAQGGTGAVPAAEGAALTDQLQVHLDELVYLREKLNRFDDLKRRFGAEVPLWLGQESAATATRYGDLLRTVRGG
jgi:hypothetical protein